MLWESELAPGLGGLLMAVTMATVGRCVAMEAGMVEVAAFSTRGRVFAVMTGVMVRVFYLRRWGVGFD